MNTTAQTTHQINATIPTDRIAELETRLKALNKKAAKYGISPLVLTKSTEHVDATREIFVTPVMVTFEPIVIAGGWQFIASIEHEVIDNANKNIVAGYGVSKEDELKYRTVGSHCEHCRTKRFRNLTYIVKSAVGETKQVGSTCLKDYLGVSVDAAVTSLEIMAEISEIDDEANGYSSTNSSARLASVENVVAMTLAIVSEKGFVSQARANGMQVSTSGIVWMNLFPAINMKEEDKIRPTEKHREEASEIIANWKTNLVPKFSDNNEDLDSFEYKVAMAVALGWVKPRLFNTLVAAAFRESNFIKEKKAPKFEKNEFITMVNIGDKVELELTVARMSKIEGFYGTTTILNLVDSEGRKVVWFASSSLDEMSWEVGKMYKIKGTVKDLKDDPRFGKQTIITRVKKV